MRRSTPGSIAQSLRLLFRSGALGGLDDEALLRRFADGRDEDAFEVLVYRHGPMVLRVCRSVLPDEHDARDAYQACFLILARRAGSIGRRGSVGPWLFGVARRVAFRARADAHRRRMHERQAAAARPEAVAAGPPELLPEVLEELGRLPERLRAPVVLCYLQGHTCESAAAALGCPPRTVHSRLRAARDRLRRRLSRRGLAPTLAALGGVTGGRAVDAAALLSLPASPLARMAAAGAVPDSVLTLVQGGLNAMAIETFLRRCAAMLLLGGAIGLGSALAGADGEAVPPTAQLPPPAPGPGDAGRRRDEPPLDPAQGAPRPWETPVRIRVLQPHSIGFGSGTVIASTHQEAIVLTCAHTFRLKGAEDETPAPEEFPHSIKVDLFDGVLRDPDLRAVVRPTGVVLDAEPIDFDFERDVALLRIRPGKVLKASPIVPPDWRPNAGMSMITVGCSNGNDATAWSTTIITPVSRIRPRGGAAYSGIECRYSPNPCRSGGGLFTADGHLAGVSNYALKADDLGVYAAPESIYHLLDRNGLSHLYRATNGPESGRPGSGALLRDIAGLPSGEPGDGPPVAIGRGRAPRPNHEEAFRAGLRALLDAGPVRLVADGDIEVSVRLDEPGDVERAGPLLDALRALGRPIRIEPSAGRESSR